MIENKKRRLVTFVEEDRISNLPEHLVDSILERVPTEDAVRTSILSKNWRYRWTKMKALVFDVQFSNKFAKNGAFGRNGFIRIINQVLFFHMGPVLKFHLHIPPSIYLDSFQEVDQWMLFLSRNGVTELILTNSNRRYELPSYVFSCVELRKLQLKNCFFKPPLEFEGYPKLEELYLENIDFGDGTQISLPQLKKLSLILCRNVCNFNIKATKLDFLFVYRCPDAIWLRLLHSLCLTFVAMYFDKPIEDNVRVEKMTLAMMLSNMPMIEYLTFDGPFFKFLFAEKAPKWLPHVVTSLKSLTLHYFELGDLDQLQVALCLLRNSPNLQRLTVRSLKKPGVIDYNVEPASDQLEAPNCLDCTLNQLQSVVITNLDGSKLELLFIKLLLAHSPSLKKFTIRSSKASDVQKRLDIAKDVMWFPRASPKAKILYLDTKP